MQTRFKLYPPRPHALPALAGAVSLGLLLSGCRGTAKPATDDASLNTALQTRLQSDPGLAGQPLQASVQGGIATLSGNVGNAAARSLAANDASEVPGIVKVVNNLALGVPPTTPAVLVGRPPTPVDPLSSRRTPTRVQPERSSVAPIDRRDEPYPGSTQSAQNQQYQHPAPPPAPEFRNVTVPSGTGLSVRITQTLDSASTQPGTSFSGVLASDVLVDGLVAFPTGTRVTGHVDDAKDAGHFKGSSLLTVSLTGINRRGEDLTITTDTFSKQGNGRGKNTAEKVGGGAAVGAILGGIFGGGKGAAIGAGAGGGLGAGAQGITRGQQVQIESESVVRFRLTSPVNVRASTRQNAQNNNDNPDLQRHDQ